jgi:hypothetical protein
MQSVSDITQDGGAFPESSSTSRARASGQKGVAAYLVIGTLLVFRGVVGLRIHATHPSQAFFAAGVCLPMFLGAVCWVLGLILAFGVKCIGRVSYQEVFDQRVVQRVRARYSSDIDELTSLGFSHAYTSGEAMDLSHILLVYPGFILLRARANGAVLTLGGGGKVLLAAPVLISQDGRTFAHPETLGVPFYTPLRDGSLLVTKNFDFPTNWPEKYMLQASDRTDTEAWQAHKERLDKINTAAVSVIRDRSYQAYADIALREDAFLKSRG